MAKARLDIALVEQGLSESRSQASSLIMAGQVYVDGVRRDKPGWQVGSNVEITLVEAPRYVSRAGYKLEGANQVFGIDFAGSVVLDVGASTGGFSDYVLQNGAKKVYAVDVGTHQLHERLRTNPKLISYEQTDIRGAKLPEAVNYVLIDVSFVSLRQILPSVVQYLKPSGRIIAMCKPQFEAGVRDASKHKGVIKNDSLRRQILRDFEDWLKQNSFITLDKTDSKLAGTKGNLERFYYLSNK